MAKKKNGDVVVKKLTDDVDVTADKQGVTDVGMNVMDVFEPTSTVVSKENVQEQLAVQQETSQGREKSPQKRWYIIHTYSGYENKVKKDLEKRIEYMNMADKIFRIEVPQKTITKVKDGKVQSQLSPTPASQNGKLDCRK